jgi:hypothetical protein
MESDPARIVPEQVAMPMTAVETSYAPPSCREAGIAHWLQIIQAEYREMPCLSLTRAQVQRLWGLDSFVCDALLDALVAARVLRRTMNGLYVKADSGH